MNLKLFNFSKKPNSTKRPDLPSGTSFDCTMIENTSLLAPSIRLKGVANMTGKEVVTVTNQAVVSFTDGVATDFNNVETDIAWTGVEWNNCVIGQPHNSNLAGGMYVAYEADDHFITGYTRNGYNIIFNSNATTKGAGSGLFELPYKEKTRYTFILVMSKSNTSRNSNLRFYYTDGTFNNIFLTDSGDVVENQKYIVVVSTSENKTLRYIRKYTGSGTTTVYLDECGVFEGTKTVDDFVPYNGNAYNIDFVENGIYGGTLNATTGVLTSTVNADGTIKETPETFAVTPIVIPQYEGVNNLWCNTGNILSCTYERYVPVTAYMYKFNYAYLQEMDRYYFITDIRYELGTWVFDLKIDTLASWKDSIGASTHYVLRASSAYDGRIIDTAYPTKVKQTTSEVYSNYTLFGNYYTDTMTCYYIVGIIGAINPAALSDATDVYNGSVVYFCLDKSQMYELIFSLLDNVDLYQIDSAEMSKQLQKQLINPIQYIHSIKCVPITPNLVKDGSLNNLVATGFYAGFQFVPITSYTPEPPTP